MRVKKVELNNFRNYEGVSLDFGAQKTLIIGQNAQGKTNLLEAIYYLSSLDSPRIRKDAELILFGCGECRAGATVLKEGVDVDLEVIISPPKNKVFKVNGLKKSKSSEFIRVLSVVNFSVNDLLLLRGEPSFRRKWLDNAICQIYPVYSEKIAKYNKIRLQKANLLDMGTGVNLDMLSVFNQQLATSGANIIFLRRKFLIELEKIALEKHGKIAVDETLSMNYDEMSERNKNHVFVSRANESQGQSPYDCDFIAGAGAEGAFPQSTAKEIETALLEHLEEIKQEEIRRGQCLVGPHRDDISFFINGIDAKKFASQGQQRTIVLALKLAELEIIKEKNNDTPVLLLDDVLAELDEVRQNYLLNGIEEGIQTIITCTDTKAFSASFLENIQVVRVCGGELQL